VTARAVAVTVRTWVLCSLACLALAGCEEELRVPYIPPTLANWPQPYRGITGLTVHVFDTGHVRLPERLVLRGGSLTRTRELPVLAFLIDHPQHGLILFDAGLSRQSAATPRGAARWVPSLIAPEVEPAEALKSQMLQAGLKPDAVRWIVLSSLRADHSGQVEDFPNARVVVSKAEHEYANQSPSGYVAETFDAVANWKFIDFAGASPLGTFAAHVDLLGDGSCLLLDAAGVSPGSMAMLVRLPRQPVLLAGDLAAVEESVRYAAKPAAADDLRQWWDHIWRLKRFKDLAPELIVLPGHDLEPARKAASKDIIIHEAVRPDAGATRTPTPRRKSLLPFG